MFSSIVLIFELIGTVAFAVSGAMVGLRQKMDIFGIFVLGLCTAVGGGMIRDLVLGRTPPASFVHPIYAAVAALAVIPTFFPFWRNLIEKKKLHYDRMMLAMDSLGLGIFTVVGVRTAFLYVEDPSLYLLIFVGVITGVGGGVMRDVMAGDQPYIFRKHFYACASIIGALVCVSMWNTGAAAGIGPDEVLTGSMALAAERAQYSAMAAGALTVFILRLLAAHYEWSLPHPGRTDGI